MKTILLATLFSLCLAPYAAFSEDREYDETTLILSSQHYEFYQDVLVDCAWAIPYLPMAVSGGWTSELYSLETDESSGKVRAAGQQVGEMWTCYDEGQEVIDPVGPSYEQAIVFVILIDGEVWGALGTVRPRANEDGRPALYGSTAGVARVVDDTPAETLGSMTVNESIDPGGTYGGSNGIVILRLFTPRDYDEEAFREFIKKLTAQ